MKKKSLITLSILLCASASIAQENKETKMVLNMENTAKAPLDPQTLWKLGRVSGEGISTDGKTLVYGVSNYAIETNSSEKNLYTLSLETGNTAPLTSEKGGESVVQITENGDIIYLFKGQLWKKNRYKGEAIQLTQSETDLENVILSPNGQYILFSKAVLIKKYHSTDKYPDLPKSDAYVFDNLDYRHWDTFNNGKFNHPFVASYNNGKIGEAIDLLQDEPFYSPQMPFGGSEDFEWTPDSKAVLYVSKKRFGTEYAVSTNTDIYRYDLTSKQTTNLTEGMNGYDTNPTYSPDGTKLTWLSMKKDGYEADKNDIIIFDKASSQRLNLTAHWDGTVNSFIWSKDNRKIYFVAPSRGTVQLFELTVPTNLKNKSLASIKQISEGNFDITGIVGQVANQLIVTSTKFTRATEIYKYDLANKTLTALTTVNDKMYAHISDNKIESRITKASDGQDLFSWVIYPPDFDPTKKYPTILYCEGGPQSALTQFYSFRWNLQLIASQGYIVIAPNRRGMPGWGVKWNEAISKDWGGQPIRDYLSAIDDISKEKYVDTTRRAAIGASYGGYSVYMLAGVHENRFKTLIAHNGLFDMRSWYGTTEELFFANHELGGPYWDKANVKSYTEFNPSEYVDKWNTPILIFQGGHDYRVPIGQGLGAFQAAQLKKIKSRLVYLPDENHWVLSGHNAQVWQREFFGWLKETL
ncbi:MULTISPECIES: S9 family peptidase [unclassified Sphingobacterium]|uniref:S9 family peptidase n=1 Tax=unclassified Sphingobacterium TaxID=2609468 RepID=UPI0010461667|nr:MULTISPECIES: S9 family peptidase [unclassified Sphingobacterium]MCS3556031.1 dipeptidyl aminopeptidase/acylaminoacyl peptidase [Sphingobacterium sp. JUb21]